jgi:hypothetical protein
MSSGGHQKKNPSRGECRQIRKDLPKYLSGHLFKTREKRIARHLEQCMVCRSEFDALKHAEETRLLLKSINSPDDFVGRAREGFSRLGTLKKILYRPLWIAGLLLIAGGLIYYHVTPRQLEIEIERIEKTAPTATQAAAPVPAVTAPPATVKGVETAQPAPAAAPAAEPLKITITPVNDEAAVQQINDTLRGHESLRAMAFTSTQMELSGSLTSKELMILFSKIEGAAKVNFNRKRFESFPSEQPIPFVMKLKPAPRPAPPAPSAPQHTSPVPAAPQQAQQPTDRSTPSASKQAPLQPETAPSQSAP